jgi:hypothetical protein
MFAIWIDSFSEKARAAPDITFLRCKSTKNVDRPTMKAQRRKLWHASVVTAPDRGRSILLLNGILEHQHASLEHFSRSVFKRFFRM